MRIEPTPPVLPQIRSRNVRARGERGSGSGGESDLGGTRARIAAWRRTCPRPPPDPGRWSTTRLLLPLLLLPRAAAAAAAATSPDPSPPASLSLARGRGEERRGELVEEEREGNGEVCPKEGRKGDEEDGGREELGRNDGGLFRIRMGK